MHLETARSFMKNAFLGRNFVYKSKLCVLSDSLLSLSLSRSLALSAACLSLPTKEGMLSICVLRLCVLVSPVSQSAVPCPDYVRMLSCRSVEVLWHNKTLKKQADF